MDELLHTYINIHSLTHQTYILVVKEALKKHDSNYYPVPVFQAIPVKVLFTWVLNDSRYLFPHKNTSKLKTEGQRAAPGSTQKTTAGTGSLVTFIGPLPCRITGVLPVFVL